MSTTRLPTLIYFSPKGRPEAIRLLAHHVGLAFREVHPEGSDGWMRMRPEMPLNQLPVWVEPGPDGDVMYPQSQAILRHLAREHGAYGRTEAERFAADIAHDTAADLAAAFSALRFSPGFKDEAARAKYLAETAHPHLERMAKLLGTRTWFASDAPTFADFTAFAVLDTHLSTWPDCLGGFPTLAAFVARVRELPSLREYLGQR